jgi:hypothetical protein
MPDAAALKNLLKVHVIAALPNPKGSDANNPAQAEVAARGFEGATRIYMSFENIIYRTHDSRKIRKKHTERKNPLEK